MRKVCLSSEEVSVCVSVCVLCIFILSPCVTIIYICVTLFIRISGLFLVRTSIGISVCLCIYLTICPLCTHEYQFFCCGKYGRTHSPTHTCPYEAQMYLIHAMRFFETSDFLCLCRHWHWHTHYSTDATQQRDGTYRCLWKCTCTPHASREYAQTNTRAYSLNETSPMDRFRLFSDSINGLKRWCGRGRPWRRRRFEIWWQRQGGKAKSSGHCRKS
jgi:hypothetical protein